MVLPGFRHTPLILSSRFSMLILIPFPTAIAVVRYRRFPHLRTCAQFRPLHLAASDQSPLPAVVSDSLRILEWDKLCNVVSSFAGTGLGREATKAQLSSVDISFEESQRLLDETSAATRLIDYAPGGLDFRSLDSELVEAAINHASRGSLRSGVEAMAIVGLIQFAEALQVTLEKAVKEDADWYCRLLPLSKLITDLSISHAFARSVQQAIDDDGSIKDSASFELRRSREHVRILERKLFELVDKFMRHVINGTTSMESFIYNGRCCIKVMADSIPFDGLLLSSGSGGGSIVEPIAAVPLNDEVQQARVSVIKAEENVLSRLTDKMVPELDNICNLFQTVIRLDVIIARAKYSIAYSGSFPELNLQSSEAGHSTKNSATESFSSSTYHQPSKKWKLYLPKAHHPLLLEQHRENLHRARKDLVDATAGRRRRDMLGRVGKEDNDDSSLQALKSKVYDLEKNHPIPVDFMVSRDTFVLVITGPNTGGKTVSLKTVGLASLMAKTGLYVLASEPVIIPWFDWIFADIGDEQSLIQSLSTFSGHLKQISAIRSKSTNKSLVLLDEVGAGTNPLEGAALGMSILESFADNGSLLTVATTHHGELKTLKYSNNAFENACMEFDELSLKPTYKILWGVPGRSNAINVAQRLGLLNAIIDGARKLHGAASAQINEVIVQMERFKQDYQHNLLEARSYLGHSKELHGMLITAKEKIENYKILQQNRKAKAISDSATVARSVMRTKLQKFRESYETESKVGSTHPVKHSKGGGQEMEPKVDPIKHSKGRAEQPLPDIPLERSTPKTSKLATSDEQTMIPAVGDTVLVTSLDKEAVVLKTEASKGEILVQASNMKLRVKLKDIQMQQLYKHRPAAPSF